MVSVSEKGGQYQHPAVGIMNQASQRIRKFGSMFGLALSERKSVELKSKLENPIEAMPREHLGRG